MRKLTQEQEKEIVDLYRGGIGSDSIAKKFNVTSTCILKVLKRNGIERRDFSRKLGNKHDDIVRKYVSGMSTPAIADMLNVTHAAILKVLKKNNIQRRTAEECHRQYQLNEGFFDNIDTEEKAYFLGFLYADGSNQKASNFIKIDLAEKDKELLQKFAKLLYPKSPRQHVKIQDRGEKGRFAHLTIHSKHMCHQLEKLGCVPQKTFKIVFPNWLREDLIRHFVRGYFDGDGSVNINYKKGRSSFLKITSTKEMTTSIRDIIASRLNITCCLYSHKSSPVFDVCTSGDRQLKKILDWMYDCSTIRLARKAKKHQELLRKIKRTDALIKAGTRGYSKSILKKQKSLPH